MQFDSLLCAQIPLSLPLGDLSTANAAFFYQIKETDGLEIDNIARQLGELDEINDTVSLAYTFSLSSLIGNINTERFYTYRGMHNISTEKPERLFSFTFGQKFMFQGSLTTPKCNPAVTWVLFPDTIPISLHQISKFRSLSNGIEGLLLVDNYRHLQPIGNRKIFLRSVSSRTTKLEKFTMSKHNTNESDDEDPSDWYYN